MKAVDFTEHPEGGRFREVFRASATVTTHNGLKRSALTHIYFSLRRGEVSRFHRVASDEIWNLYRGDGLRLYTWDGGDNSPVCSELSARGNDFCHVIPAGVWQAAEPIGDSVLVGCSVGPGFEFQDFEMMIPESTEAARLRSLDPNMLKFIIPVQPPEV